MTLGSVICFGSALFSAALAVGVLARGRRSAANWFFLAGMLGLAIENAFTGIGLTAATQEKIQQWETLGLVAGALLPGIWLGFSLAYSRGNAREFLLRWSPILALTFLIPVVLLVASPEEILQLQTAESPADWRLAFGTAGKILNVVLLVTVVLVLMNLEKTFRTAVGTMRWRIKFVVLGLCVIFGAKIYVGSQALLYSSIDVSLLVVEAAALLIGCALIAVSLLRSGRTEIDVYPSHSFLYGSITFVLAGVYLLTVGLLAKVAVAVGHLTGLPLNAFLVLIGIVSLAVLLLSDRLRQRTQRFVSRHFKRPLYDYRKVWAQFTAKTADATSPATLCAATAKLVSDTFNVLSATLWLADESERQLTFAASTSLTPERVAANTAAKLDLDRLLAALREKPYPVDLDESREDWAQALREFNPAGFRKGGHRICVPIVAGEQALGVIILADRVSGLPFSLEELDLLRCIGSHVAANLLSLQLSQQLMAAKEQEAFRAVSAFFAHDLKNAASTLSLMLQNLPHHFEDPSFRADVLRGISKTVNHMNHLINRLSVLRQKPEITPVSTDLNDVVGEALRQWDGLAGIELTKQLEPVPNIPIDPRQIQNVVTNLVLNAREAVGPHGHIRVSTARQNGWAILTVSDDGCGMTREFLRQSLFRPFQTTKKDGTGIGMFQCKMIVEAHRGRIEVESEPGKGSSFRILLPLQLSA